MALDLRAAADLPCGLAVARAELQILDGYPNWLGIVHRVVGADGHPDDPGPAWWVDLGGRIGIVRKTKRVRMVRSALLDELIRFERLEFDGRTHNSWVLEARLEPRGPGCTGLDMAVHYSGDRRLPVLDAVLRAEVGRAGRRLAERVSGVG